MLVTARAGNCQAIRCDDSHQRQHCHPRVERPSIQPATRACLPPERHLQRGPSRSRLSCAAFQGGDQTAKSASPRCDVHLLRNLRVLLFMRWSVQMWFRSRSLLSSHLINLLFHLIRLQCRIFSVYDHSFTHFYWQLIWIDISFSTTMVNHCANTPSYYYVTEHGPSGSRYCL